MKQVRTLILLALCATVAPFAALSGVVCGKESIAGFGPQHDVAVLLLGPATSDIDKCKVYVTRSKEFLYVQSNYLPLGCKNPIKLATEEELDLRLLILNLLYFKNAPKDMVAAAENVDGAIADKIHFYVDREALRTSRFATLDFSAAKNVIWDPPRPEEVSTTQQFVDLPKAAALPGNLPISQPVLPPPRLEKTPEGFAQAAVALLWTSLPGRCALCCILAGAVLLAIWATLPDSVKERVVNHVWPHP